MQMFYYSVDVISKFGYFQFVMTNCMFISSPDGARSDHLVARWQQDQARKSKSIRGERTRLYYSFAKHSWHGMIYTYLLINSIINKIPNNSFHFLI